MILKSPHGDTVERVQERNLDVGEESAAVTAMSNVIGAIQVFKEALKTIPDVLKYSYKFKSLNAESKIKIDKKKRAAEREKKAEEEAEKLSNDSKLSTINPETGEIKEVSNETLSNNS